MKRKNAVAFLKKSGQLFRIFLLISGSVFLISCILAFTTLPYYARYWLGTHHGQGRSVPASIILLGGSGMPSEDGFMRCYYTAILAKKYPLASVIIAIPGDTTDSLASPFQLRRELELRGVVAQRISFEPEGHNTRQQALNIMAGGKTEAGKPVTLVTSPEHMYRAVLSFEKAGYRQVQGQPTFENSIGDDQLYFNDRELKGNTAVPPIGHNKQLRYQFWNHLRYEILVLREYFALAYYKLRAWI